MTGFVTWPPFLYQNYYKDGQVLKPYLFTRLVPIGLALFYTQGVFVLLADHNLFGLVS